MSTGSAQDVKALQEIGRIVALTLRIMRDAMTEGMTTAELDAIGRDVLRQHGARPAPELLYKYPGATCISINEEVAHAIPGPRRIRNGDMVNIDVSAELNGYFADTGASIPFGHVPPVAHKLCQASKLALREAIKVARAGNRMDEVQKAVDKVARRNGFSVITNLAGHGIGRHLHEAPEHVPDYTRKKDRRRFTRGMVLTLEPFLSTGPTMADDTADGWTLVTPPGNLTAQYEHTIIVTDREPLIVTAGSGIH